jgi:methylated-DNA-[protein]-cysteine S-methyltransferase
VITSDTFQTPVGSVVVTLQGDQVCRLAFGTEIPPGTPRARLDRARRWIRDWFSGRDPRVPLRIEGTSFARQIYEAVRSIPRGETRTYAQVALAAGRPGAARAVGQALARNPICLFIPCHRVVGASGLGGFSGEGGLAQKRLLLGLEGGKGAPRRP